MTRQAVIIDAVAHAGGPARRHAESLASGRSAGLHAHGLVARNKLDPARIDDVIAGCVMQVGEQAVNVGRNAVSLPAFPNPFPAPRSTASAAPASRPFILPRRA